MSKAGAPTRAPKSGATSRKGAAGGSGGGASRQPRRSSPSASAVEEIADDDDNEEEEEEEAARARIPEELVSRILHEFSRREDTRVSRSANRALGRYFEIFVQEAIARTAQERDGRFLEVEDLEKVTPQLIMDL